MYRVLNDCWQFWSQVTFTFTVTVWYTNQLFCSFKIHLWRHWRVTRSRGVTPVSLPLFPLIWHLFPGSQLPHCKIHCILGALQATLGSGHATLLTGLGCIEPYWMANMSTAWSPIGWMLQASKITAAFMKLHPHWKYYTIDLRHKLSKICSSGSILLATPNSPIVLVFTHRDGKQQQNNINTCYWKN